MKIELTNEQLNKKMASLDNFKLMEIHDTT